MADVLESTQLAPAQRVPRLETGDHLDQKTFHERYKQTPQRFRAELIGGVVIVPSPLAFDHGTHHSVVMGWLVNYWESTPGTRALDNATTILGPDSEPQPDAALIIESAHGGQTRVSSDGYLTGPPELIVEIASSSEAYDLYEKRRDYQRAGVREYVVIMLRERAVRWFVLDQDTYRELTPSDDGVYRSRVFPGLWLNASALARLDITQVLATLRQGLASPEHVAFVARLQTQ